MIRNVDHGELTAT